jgi:hypothetical protein
MTAKFRYMTARFRWMTARPQKPIKNHKNPYYTTNKNPKKKNFLKKANDSCLMLVR